LDPFSIDLDLWSEGIPFDGLVEAFFHLLWSFLLLFKQFEALLLLHHFLLLPQIDLALVLPDLVFEQSTPPQLLLFLFSEAGHLLGFLLVLESLGHGLFLFGLLPGCFFFLLLSCGLLLGLVSFNFFDDLEPVHVLFLLSGQLAMQVVFLVVLLHLPDVALQFLLLLFDLPLDHLDSSLFQAQPVPHVVSGDGLYLLTSPPLMLVELVHQVDLSSLHARTLLELKLDSLHVLFSRDSAL